MKFRTDFVTNSSSTSYIVIRLYFPDGDYDSLLFDDYEGTGVADAFKLPDNKMNIEEEFSSLKDVVDAVKRLYEYDGDDYFHIAKSVEEGLEKNKDKQLDKLEISIYRLVNTENPFDIERTVFDFKNKIMYTETDWDWEV